MIWTKNFSIKPSVPLLIILTVILFSTARLVLANPCVTSTSPEDITFIGTTFNDLKGVDNFFDIYNTGNILCHRCKFISNKIEITDCKAILAKSYSGNKDSGRLMLYDQNSIVDCSKNSLDLGRKAISIRRSLYADGVIIENEIRQISKINKQLTKKLSGQILLQVEAGTDGVKGRAWYLDPKSGNKFLIVNGQMAFEIMQILGQGISTENLEKIPLGYDQRLFTNLPDTDKDGLPNAFEVAIATDPDKADTNDNGYSDSVDIKNGYDPRSATEVVRLGVDQALIKRLGNGIFLQVTGLNARGQAWLVKDGQRFFVDPSTAFNAMRFLSTGISNSNLRTIQTGQYTM